MAYSNWGRYIKFNDYDESTINSINPIKIYVQNEFFSKKTSFIILENELYLGTNILVYYT